MFLDINFQNQADKTSNAHNSKNKNPFNFKLYFWMPLGSGEPLTWVKLFFKNYLGQENQYPSCATLSVRIVVLFLSDDLLNGFDALFGQHIGRVALSS